MLGRLRNRTLGWLFGRPAPPVLTPASVKANLVRALQDYFVFTVGTDIRKATRQQRRRFAEELSDLILEHIAVKGQ